MAKFIIFLDRLIYLYLCFVMCACLMSWIPNINPDYPLFHAIFTTAGFYLIPPVFGLGIAPALVMCVCALVSYGLGKIYQKFFAKKDSKIVVVTPDELIQKLKEQEQEFIKKEQEENNDDSV